MLTPAGGGQVAVQMPQGPSAQVTAVGGGCVQYGDAVVIANTPEGGYTGNCGWYGCRVGAMVNNKMLFGHGAATPTGFYIRPAVGSGNSGCVSYGDPVVIAQTSDGGNTGCGWYGCRVAAMWGDNTMGFGHGTSSPHNFYFRPLPNSGLFGHVQYGHQVVIAYTSNAGWTSNCGWYGCRVGAMWGDNSMGFGHGSSSPQAFYLRSTVPIAASWSIPAQAT